jgi:hypothetical protein
MAAFLSVFSSLLVGLLLVFIPWVTIQDVNLWESNYLLQAHPMLRALILNAFVRGAVTGLGLVNLLLALLEAHEHLRDLREGRRDV